MRSPPASSARQRGAIRRRCAIVAALPVDEGAMTATAPDQPRDSLQTGLRAGLLAMALALLGAFPSRLLLSMREGDPLGPGLRRVVAGTLLDASAVIPSIAVVVVVVAGGLPLVLRGLRRPRWCGAGPLLVALLPAFATMVLSMIAQQVHAERGAFPTAFDILESGGNASFIEGVLGFLGYRHIQVPTALTALAAIALLVAALRRPATPRVGPWALGVVLGVVLGVLPVQASARALGSAPPPLHPESLGEPLAGLIDSGLDLLRYGDKATPRQLVVDIELDDEDGRVHARGAGLLGWPATSRTMSISASASKTRTMPSTGMGKTFTTVARPGAKTSPRTR